MTRVIAVSYQDGFGCIIEPGAGSREPGAGLRPLSGRRSPASAAFLPRG